jgi:predicted RNase H-like HicB family nuclease
MKTYTYKTIIEPDEDGYHGFVPLLKGVHTWGKTVEETKKNLEEAIQVHLEGLLKMLNLKEYLHCERLS